MILFLTFTFQIILILIGIVIVASSYELPKIIENKSELPKIVVDNEANIGNNDVVVVNDEYEE